MRVKWNIVRGSGRIVHLVLSVFALAYGAGTLRVPGQSNIIQTAVGYVEEVQFSVARGFYEAPFGVELSCPTPGADIRFSTNGTAPSPTNGFVYSIPIQIKQTTTLRAVALKTGFQPSPVGTHTYLFLNDVILQSKTTTLASGFPATWQGTTADYGMDTKVIGTNNTDRYGGKYARTIITDLEAVPTLSIVSDINDFFGAKGVYSNPNNRGMAWERPASLELIDPKGASGFQIDAGVRIQGGAFRGFGLTKKKSFRLFFRSEYGHGKLHYPLFGPDAVDSFDTLVLRANNNDGWQWDAAAGQPLYIRDAFADATARAMGMVAPHCNFVHLYINGVYWGLYNPVERPDAAFSASYYGGNKEDWDAINFDSAPNGDYGAWNRMIALARKGLANNVNYQLIQGNNPDGTRNPAYEDLLDVDSLIDYMILNCYLGNNDWPDRNWYTGRNRANGDGFKFYPWDSEWTVGLNSDVNADKTGASTAVAVPYAACKANSEFRLRFADRVYRHFFDGGPLYVDAANPFYDLAHPERNPSASRFASLCNVVSNAVVAESARWGDQHAATPYTRDEHWLKEQHTQLTNYFPRRSGIVLSQFRRAGLYPNTDPPAFAQNGGHVASGFSLGMSASKGTIYYTTDGSDPCQPEAVEEISRLTILSNSAPKKVLVPSTANGGSLLGIGWMGANEPFNDQNWTSGSGGAGYDREVTYRPYIQIDVKTEMDSKATSLFIRIPFVVNSGNLNQFNYMTLRMRYDDGFAAFLNGVRIASANAPASLQWNSVASVQNADSATVAFEEFKVDGYLSVLRPGTNMLAIQGLNLSLSSTDFLIDAELAVGQRKILGGGSNGSAYSKPVVLTDLTTVKARVLNGTEWSALKEATFVVGDPKLIFSEINYHPSPATASEQTAGFIDADLFEFVELYNAGDGAMDMRGAKISGGIEFQFSNSGITRLNPGAALVLAKNKAAFEKRYGTNIALAGEYAGSLSNGGETIAILDANDMVIHSIAYGTRSPWPRTADGEGPSLEIVDPQNKLTTAENWQASLAIGGSPGYVRSNTTLVIEAVEIKDNQFVLRFQAQAGRSYTVRSTSSVGKEGWQYFKTIAPQPVGGPVEILIDLSSKSVEQYFQIASP
jgi:hypothetical protein